MAGQLRIVDYLNYANVGADKSFGAYPAGNPLKRQVFHFATPSAANDNTIPAVRINEWLASSAGSDDWFELYNPNAYPVNLAGFTLTDDAAAPNRFRIPSGVLLPSHGFLVVWADDGDGRLDERAALHANFKLSAAGETITLFGPDGSLVDNVAFGAQENEIAQGRFPDGSETISPRMTPPTPGAANRVANSVALRVLSLMVGANGTVSVEWISAPGRVYRVQYKNHLAEFEWKDLGGDVTATGETATKSDASTGGISSRVYRVVQLP